MPLTANAKAIPANTYGPASWQDFLENCPVGHIGLIEDITPSGLTRPQRLGFGGGGFGGPPLVDDTPIGFDVEFDCTSEKCNGRRNFFQPTKLPVVRYTEDILPQKDRIFVEYYCKNCYSRFVFALEVALKKDSVNAGVLKIGQWPAICRPLPSSLERVLERTSRTALSLFRKGYQAEKQGFGIGAYAYYRQALEHKRKELLSIFLEVVEEESIELSAEARSALEKAQNDTQFKSALKEINIPDEMMIGGVNPLLLIHSVLSEGLHSMDDAECLKYALDIRIAMEAIAERLVSLRQNRKQVKESLTRLQNRTQDKKAGS